MAQPLVERHYIVKSGTKNLPGVAQEISQEDYNRIFRHATTLGDAQERRVGQVEDRTAYYNFSGISFFLENGLVHVGSATTTDNMSGFGMIRLFANSLDSMHNLTIESSPHDARLPVC